MRVSFSELPSEYPLLNILPERFINFLSAEKNNNFATA